MNTAPRAFVASALLALGTALDDIDLTAGAVPALAGAVLSAFLAAAALRRTLLPGDGTAVDALPWQQARAAGQRGDFGRAFTLLDTARRRFPAGSLIQVHLPAERVDQLVRSGL